MGNCDNEEAKVTGAATNNMQVPTQTTVASYLSRLLFCAVSVKCMLVKCCGTSCLVRSAVVPTATSSLPPSLQIYKLDLGRGQGGATGMSLPHL